MSEGHIVPARVGFFGGIGTMARGAALVVKTPALWPLAIVPFAMASIGISALATLGVWGSVELASSIIPDASSTWGLLGLWALRIALSAFAIIVSYLLAAALAQPASGWALDRIVHRIRASRGEPALRESPFLEGLFRSARVSLVSLAVALPLLAILTAIDIAFPPAAIVCVPLKFVVGAFTLAWDFLDYPLSLRGMGVRARIRFMRDNLRAVLGLGLCSGALMLVPCVGLLFLPMGVAAASLLASELESRRLLGP